MSNSDFDLSKMTVEDLFRAKEERKRRRLANLPFEKKMEIVEKLNAVWREALRDMDQKDAEQPPEPTKTT